MNIDLDASVRLDRVVTVNQQEMSATDSWYFAKTSSILCIFLQKRKTYQTAIQKISFQVVGANIETCIDNRFSCKRE